MNLFVNSLAAERRAAEAKGWVARKVSHVSTVSHDLICSRWRMKRVGAARQLQAAVDELRKATQTGVTALSWEQATDADDDAVPTGVRFTHDSHCSRSPAPRGGGDSTGSGMATFVNNRHDDLARMRRERIATAEANVARLSHFNGMPTTRLQLAAWVSDHIEEFRARMVEAPARRRARSFRVWPRDGLPQPLKRIQPKAEVAQPYKTEWATILDGRTGWLGLRTSMAKRLLYVVHHRGNSYCIDLEPYRDGDDFSYSLGDGFDVRSALNLLNVLEDELPDMRVHGVFAFEVHGKPAAGGGVQLAPHRWMQLTDPLPAKVKANTPAGENEYSAEELEPDIMSYASDVSVAVADGDALMSSSDESIDDGGDDTQFCVDDYVTDDTTVCKPASLGGGALPTASPTIMPAVCGGGAARVRDVRKKKGRSPRYTTMASSASQFVPTLTRCVSKCCRGGKGPIRRELGQHHPRADRLCHVWSATILRNRCARSSSCVRG